jgi:hypothetical protein
MSNLMISASTFAMPVSWMQAEFRLTGIEQIGKRQVIAFWKAHRDMAPATAYAYWLAVKVLWGWLGRMGEPPMPRSPAA